MSICYNLGTKLQYLFQVGQSIKVIYWARLLTFTSQVECYTLVHLGHSIKLTLGLHFMVAFLGN